MLIMLEFQQLLVQFRNPFNVSSKNTPPPKEFLLIIPRHVFSLLTSTQAEKDKEGDAC